MILASVRTILAFLLLASGIVIGVNRTEGGTAAELTPVASPASSKLPGRLELRGSDGKRYAHAAGVRQKPTRSAFDGTLTIDRVPTEGTYTLTIDVTTKQGQKPARVTYDVRLTPK